MGAHQEEPPVDTGTPPDDDRRKFLAACGRFAVVTPPALTLLLSTSLNSKAIAHSGGRGDHDHDDHDHRNHRGDEDLWDSFEKWLEKLF
jgi:hypothetical protein